MSSGPRFRSRTHFSHLRRPFRSVYLLITLDKGRQKLGTDRYFPQSVTVVIKRRLNYRDESSIRAATGFYVYNHPRGGWEGGRRGDNARAIVKISIASSSGGEGGGENEGEEKLPNGTRGDQERERERELSRTERSVIR